MDQRTRGTLADPRDIEDAAVRYPSFAPQVDDVVARAVAAGAAPPLAFLGVGMTGAVFCDALGRGWKVARDEGAKAFLRDEARWLAVAGAVPWVRDHVARFGSWHERQGVIERECVRPATKAPPRWMGSLHGLHREIERLVAPYGYRAPEFKEDSYVFTRDRGPVLVDASMALPVGHRLLRQAAQAHRDPRASAFDRETARWEIRMELGESVPEAVGQRLHDRLLATAPNGPSKATRPQLFAPLLRNAARTMPNPARAARPYYDGREYHPEPATLTEGHFELPEVRRAAEVASWTTNQDWRPRAYGWGTARHLGHGNFGVAWRVAPIGEDGAVGEPSLVKLPAAFDVHGRAWPRDAQRENLMHEAGVANEVAERHPGLVPRSVYTEFMGGTPAIVREYGEPVGEIAPVEYEALERELLAVEREDGWRVADDIVLYRRPDGSLFVGDVGFWRAPPREPRPWSADASDLDRELARVQQIYLPGLAVDESADVRPGQEWRRRRAVPSLAFLVAAAPGVRDEHAALAAGGDFLWSTWSRSLLRAIAERAALGLHALPPEVAEVVPLAEVVDRAAPDDDDGGRAERDPRRRDRARSMPNPARAARLYRGGQYRPEPPSLTPGHLDLPEVQEAARHALWTTDQQWRHRGEPWGTASYLERGNFGMAYRVGGPDGPRLVKLAADQNLHGHAWSRREGTENLMHEAGVANELRAAGITSVPEAVYAEFDGGTPAIVREYGEPASEITPAEYGALEADLVRAERELGWRVHDQLDLYRRSDGSLFVADVGFWAAPDPEATKPWKARDTDLDGLLARAQTHYMGRLLRETEGDRPKALRAHDGPRPVATLARLYDVADSVRREYEWLAEREELTRHDAQFSRSLLASLEHRAALGLPGPPPDIEQAALLAAQVSQRAPAR